MSTYGSDLQLRGVRVDKLIYNINDNFNNLDNIEKVDISITPTPKISKEHAGHGMLELEVTLFDEDYLEKNNPLFLKMKIVGFFEDTKMIQTKMFLINIFQMLLACYIHTREHILHL